MSKKRPALLVFVFFLALYALFSIGHFGGDGYEDYLTAESIVLDGNLSLYDNPDDPDDLQYDMSAGIKGKNGKVYKSRSGLGVPLLLVPFYLAGHILSLFFKNLPHDYITMLAVSFANPFISAVNCFLVFVIGREMKLDLAVSFAVSFIYGLATMSPVYARTGFAEPAMALFLLLSVFISLRYKDTRRPFLLVLTAFLLAYMVFIKLSSVIFLPCVVFYVLWLIKDAGGAVKDKLKRVSLFFAVLAALGAGVAFYNYAVYGDPLRFGASHVVEISGMVASAPHVIKGLYYYLLSPGKSFFLFNLPVVFAFLALPFVPGEHKKEKILFILIFAVNLLFYVKSFRRGSLFSWGPRYLLPSVPLLMVLSGYFLERFKGLSARLSVWLVSVAGFFIMLPCMFINQSKFYFFVVKKLKLDEYMINFIPDLSPVKGAWWMFASRLSGTFGGGSLPFVFAPDYRLVKPVSALMNDYNYFDLWFLKVMESAPGLAPFIYAPIFLLALTAAISLWLIIGTDPIINNGDTPVVSLRSEPTSGVSPPNKKK